MQKNTAKYGVQRCPKKGAGNKQVKMRQNQIKQLGNYHFIGKTLGKGHFGFVEMAVHVLTKTKVYILHIFQAVLAKFYFVLLSYLSARKAVSFQKILKSSEYIMLFITRL